MRCTVLVVAHRHAPWIAECLESVLAQTEPVSLIVIDDASPDGTSAEIERVLGTGHEHVVVHHRDNIGLAASLVEGLALVRTDYVAYLAGDDLMEAERVRIQVDLLEARPAAALAYSDAFRCDARGTRFDLTFAQRHPDVWRPRSDDPFSDLLRANWIPAPTVLIRTAALRAVGGYDPAIFFEDHDVYLRLARHHDLVCADRPLATHRELGDSYGARMFFRPENRAEWLRARVAILTKHLGARADTDPYVATVLRELIWELYAEGGYSARETRRRLADLSPHLAVLRQRWVTRLGPAGRRLARARRRRRSIALVPR